MKICIYPGGFDPFHKGHADVIEQTAATLEMGEGDMFIIVPDVKAKKDSNTSLAQRCEIVRIASTELKEKVKSDIKVFDPYYHGITSGGGEHMKNVTLFVKEKRPDAVCYTIMGDDRFLAFKKKKSPALMQNVVVVTRDETFDEVATAASTLPKKPTLVKGKLFGSSATKIRENISNKGGYDAISDCISLETYDYIVNQGLYTENTKSIT